ncbi:MAG: outer membrane beta-barrel protein [Paludibacter sp.]
MKHILLFSLFLSLSIVTFAQRSVQSTVYDSKNGLPIEMANVRLLHSPDSTFVTGCQTDSKGDFMMSKIKSGNYILVISSIGYINFKQTISVLNKDVILKGVQLQENVQLLKEVQVTGNAAQMVVKGDTMEYNATAFKTAENAVVEDLLKRLPGVEVSTDGKITVNGEAVTKIRVNGKKFFNDDVEMATKNIPAELIDKIQVLDQKSDMAQLTGFEDNDTERIINLTFKPNRKKGTFGNVTGGAGMDTNKELRYDGNLFLNLIDGEAQTTITGGGNNTNTARSSRGRGGWGGRGNSGITTTQNVGVNNNTIINPNLKVGGDGSLNHSFNDTQSTSNQQTYLIGSTNTNTSKSAATVNNYSANLRLEMEWKVDSMNTVIFQPNLSYSSSFTDSNNDYSYSTDSVRTSWGSTKNYGNGTSINGGLGIIYNHKFASKKGRTFTANFQSGISRSNNESFNESKKLTSINDSTMINQRTTNVSDNNNFSLRLAFVEPLWNLKNFLETSVYLSESHSTSDKIQYDRLRNDSINYDYSNNFENNFYRESLEFNYRYIDNGYNLMFGMKGEPSQNYSTRTYANGNILPITNEVLNFSPTARLQYNFGKKKFARLDYRGQTEQPSISQMQPVKNNSNLMNETVGNPDLKPAFNQSLRVMYSAFNDQTFSSFNTFLRAEYTKDDLVTNSLYDVTGKQYSQTVNASNMPYSVNGNVMFNTPLIQKLLHFNTNTSAGYDMRYGYSARGLTTVNTDSIIPLGDLSSTGRYNLGEQIALTFTEDAIEIGARGSIRYSNTKNNLNPKISETYDWSGGGNIILHLPYSINIGTDLNYTTQQGYSTSAQNQLIWNASFDKTLFKNKGVLSLKVNDILRQQLNIRQTIGDNYIQYNTYNTLTSYFLLSFTYKINKFSGTQNNPAEMDRMNRFGPGGDHPHRGDGGGGFRGDH